MSIKPGALIQQLGHGRSIYRPIGVALVVAVLAAACGDSPTTVGTEPETNTTGVNLASDFGIQVYRGEDVLGGSKIAFSSLFAGGKPVVLNFWSGLCPPCRAEMPVLQRFYEDFKGQVTLLGLDVGQFHEPGSQSDPDAFLDDVLIELPITYPQGFATDASVMVDYEVLSMPTTVLINSRREVFQKWSGPVSLDVLTRVTKALLTQESASAS